MRRLIEITHNERIDQSSLQPKKLIPFAVGQKKHIPSLELCPYSGLDQIISLKVNSCCRFIQNQDLDTS